MFKLVRTYCLLILIWVCAGVFIPVEAQFFQKPGGFLKDNRNSRSSKSAVKARKNVKAAQKKSIKIQATRSKYKTGHTVKRKNLSKAKPNYQKRNNPVSSKSSFKKYKKRGSVKMSKRKSLYKKTSMKKKGSYNNRKGGKASSKFGRKVSLGVWVGPLFTNKDQGIKLDASGLTENIFASSQPGFAIGGYLYYNVSKNLAFGGRIKYLHLQNTVYKVNQIALGIDLKYNFIPSDKRISPYIFGEFGFTLLGIQKGSSTNSVKPDPSFSIVDPNSVPVTQVTYAEPERNVSFIPVWGYAAGLGVDLRIREALGMFVQIEYASNFTSSTPSIVQNFNNKSSFQYVLVSVGVKINAFKSKRLY